MFIFNSFSLIIQFQYSKLIIIILSFCLPSVAQPVLPVLSVSFAHTALSPVFSLISPMRDPRDRPHPDVLRDEVLSREVVEHVPVFDAGVFLLLLRGYQLLKFFEDDVLHPVEYRC